MKNFFLTLILLPAIFLAQTIDKSSTLNFKDLNNEIPKIQLNKNIYLVGDLIKYNVFILDSKGISSGSKIAYVQLIAPDNSKVFSHKLLLEKGVGYSDYFIKPDNLTGNYKLIVFTNWSKNNSEGIIIKDIVIINPFTSNKATGNIKQDEIKINKTNKLNYIKKTNTNISLTTNKNTYSTREEMIINLNFDSNVDKGKYSLSIQKLDSLPILNLKNNYCLLNNKNFIFIPELRGQIISGKITSINNAVSNDQKISLSIGGENGFSKISKTNENGNFYFNIDRKINNDQLYFQIIGQTKEDFKIEIDRNEVLDYNNLSFNKITLDESIKELIEQKNIYNQIQNAYISTKQNKFIQTKNKKNFYSPYGTTFNLDDYKRFKTVRETFIEVVTTAGLRKNNDKYHFVVYENESNALNNTVDGLKPLLLVDGILIQNEEDFINFDAKNIKSITTVKEQYYYGYKLFNGIIDVKTYNNDFYLPTYNNLVFNIKYLTPQTEKTYYIPNYNENKLETIPDYREDLIWIPSISITNNQSIYKTFTSDVKGEFVIELSGYNNKGEKIEINKIITVN